ncbi:MAG: radical SAM protein [Gammaproteobacteria bacterium]|nr:radical SAM protein [Gammaproteobacteria bacterium]
MVLILEILKKNESFKRPVKDGIGYTDSHGLEELWFHTGTACNLSCPFCLEGSRPGDNRLQRISLADAVPYIDEAVTLGVKQFSFTGGEPFIVKDFIKILDYASQHRPCLVLTNGTEPLIRRIDTITPLANNPHPIHFRVSLDYPEAKRHEAGRGDGNFHKALDGLRLLHRTGFTLSVARQMTNSEDKVNVEHRYRRLFLSNGLPADIPLVAFPDFLTPRSSANVPQITEQCMIDYHNEESRRKFMCAYSRMLVKQGGNMHIYACTLVDDDPFYNLGESLHQSIQKRIYLRHHRCYSCFTDGASCSERVTRKIPLKQIHKHAPIQFP